MLSAPLGSLLLSVFADQVDGACHVKVYVAPVPRTATEADVSLFPVKFSLSLFALKFSQTLSVSHLFLHCPVADFLWNTLFGTFGECWVCPAILDRFLLTSCAGFWMRKEAKSFFGVFGWNVILAPLMKIFVQACFVG